MNGAHGWIVRGFGFDGRVRVVEYVDADGKLGEPLAGRAARMKAEDVGRRDDIWRATAQRATEAVTA